MKVKLLVEFEVEPVEDDDEFDESHAKSAASSAAYNFLSLVTVSGVSTDTDSVKVHAEGFGKCIVRIGEDHE